MRRFSIGVGLIAGLCLFGCGPTTQPRPEVTQMPVATATQESGGELEIADTCSSSADCPYGQVCLFEHCTEESKLETFCLADDDCSLGEICVGTQCTPVYLDPDDAPDRECDEDADCPTFMYCDVVRHSCKAREGRCANTAGCPPGYICTKDHRCEKASNYCESHSDCPYGEECPSYEKQCECSPACSSLGKRECWDRTVYGCVAGANGCNKWTELKTCRMGEYCQSGICTECTHGCDYEGQEERECPDGSPAEIVRKCRKNKDGCLYWYETLEFCGGNGQNSWCYKGTCYP